MRILSAAVVAAFFAVGTVSAYAQAADKPAAPAATAKPKCKTIKAEADCTAAGCTWDAKGSKCKKAKKK